MAVRETGRLFHAWHGSLTKSSGPTEWRMLVAGPMLFQGSRAMGKDPRAADVGATMIYSSDREARSLGAFIEVLLAFPVG